MDEKLTLRYDRAGDILYIHTVPPYAAQESEEIDYGVVARLNPATDEVENLEILWFSKRLQDDALFELPIVAEMRLPERVA